MRRALVALAAAVLVPAAVAAAELRSVVVTHDDGIYSVDSEVWFDAPQKAVFAVFSDWHYTESFSSVVVEAHSTGRDENGRGAFYVKNRACFLFFCKTTERRGSVEATPDTLLIAIANPDESDFRQSDERWTFAPESGGTLVNYRLRMQPAFWVPPLIGPYLVKRKLESEGRNALERIERVAQQWQAEHG